jgi:predicted nuclease of restriction endonuclease-like RecB superfamily
LRSSYEFIYASWLDDNNLIWDIEYKSFRLIDNSLYKPDFFIFDIDDNLKEIVEIKGFWKNRSYKFDLLKKQLENDGIECKMISDNDILYYTKDQLKNITKIWKSTRLRELK